MHSISIVTRQRKTRNRLFYMRRILSYPKGAKPHPSPRQTSPRQTSRRDVSQCGQDISSRHPAISFTLSNYKTTQDRDKKIAPRRFQSNRPEADMRRRSRPQPLPPHGCRETSLPPNGGAGGNAPAFAPLRESKSNSLSGGGHAPPQDTFTCGRSRPQPLLPCKSEGELMRGTGPPRGLSSSSPRCPGALPGTRWW